jgi:hypothetical protein
MVVHVHALLATLIMVFQHVDKYVEMVLLLLIFVMTEILFMEMDAQVYAQFRPIGLVLK